MSGYVIFSGVQLSWKLVCAATLNVNFALLVLRGTNSWLPDQFQE